MKPDPAQADSVSDGAEPRPPHAALHTVLADHDVHCPACGYNLRGLREPGCPECGAEVTWDALLRRTTRIDPAWVVALVALSTALPECVLKWQRLAYRRLFFYGEQRWDALTQTYSQPQVTLTDPWFVGSTLYWHLIPLALLLLWRGRRRFAAMPAWARWSFAGLCVVGTLLGHRRLMFWYYLMGFDHDAPWPQWYLDG